MFPAWMVAYAALVNISPGGLGFNIDTSDPLVFDGPAKSLFGFSVGLHETRGRKWILVGAPKANVSAVPSLVEPGGLFKCDVTKNGRCYPINVERQGNRVVNDRRMKYREQRDGAWLGVALDNRPGHNGTAIVVCGHRWIDTKYRYHYMMNGVCYETDITGLNVRKWSPLVERKKQILQEIYNYKLGLAGMAVHYVRDGATLLMGAPGVYDFAGAVVSYKYGVKHVAQPRHMPSDSYIGYSVSSGKFFSGGITSFLTGAPRWQNTGKIFIFKENFNILVEKEGSQTGEYFGATVCSVDLNSDGLDDILVGAPLYAASSPDQGRVFVYINRDLGKLEQSVILYGSRKRAARFGSAISSAGDLNKDGYPDVLIGAPYEEDGSGAVYVYHGLRDGITPSYAQRIAATDVRASLRGFGASISRGLDIDSNNYPGIAVGAYASDSVVLLRSRPVIDIDVTMDIIPKHINLNQSNCEDRKATCIGVIVKFFYRGEGTPNFIDIVYEVRPDAERTVAPPRARVVTENGLAFSITRDKRLRKKILDADNQFKLIIRDNIRDIVSPIAIMVNYTLKAKDASCTLCPTLNALKPTSVITKATFERECGPDDVCTTDVKVTAEMTSPEDRDYVILGEKKRLEVLVTVANKGEPSYMTDVMIRLPRGLKFIGAEKISGRTDAVCSPQKKHVNVEHDSQPPRNSTDVVCDVGNPMRPRSKVVFKVRLDTENVPPSTRILDIEFEVTTGSDEILSYKDDNKVVLHIPVLLESDYSLMGVSKPEQVVHQCVASNNTEDVGLFVTHFYDVRNTGPGLLPDTLLEVTVPRRLYPAAELLDIIQVVGDSDNGRKITCSFKKSALPVPETHTVVSSVVTLDSQSQSSNASADDVYLPRMGSVMMYQKLETLRIDCKNALCIKVTCDLGHMQPGSSVIVRLQVKVRLTTLDEFKDINGIDIVTEATAFSDNHETNGVSQPKSAEVVTHFYSAVPVKSGDFPLWLIGASAAGGVVLFGVLTAILCRCGFFRRKHREELQKLINESVSHLDGDADQDSESDADGLAATHARSWTRPGAGALHHGFRNPSTPDSSWAYGEIPGAGHAIPVYSGHLQSFRNGRT